MRIEAEVSRGRGLRFGLLASGTTAALLLLVLSSPTAGAAALAALLITAVSLAALRLGAPDPARRRRRVAADARGLSLDGELALPRHAFARTLVRQDGDEHVVVVEPRGLGAPHLVHVPSARIAQALADTLETAPDEPIEFDALPPWAHRMRGLAIVLTTSPWILFSVARHLPGPLVATIVALYALLGVPIVVPRKVAIGEDGVLLRWMGRRRFLGFGQIGAVRRVALGVVIDLVDGEAIEIRLGHRPDAFGNRADAMQQRIEEGVIRHRALEPAEDEAILERGARDLETWVRDLRALGEAETTYRTFAMPRERLWRVLENPTASVSAREGAAIALRWTLKDDERDRVHAIAQKTASPKLRIALEAVSDDRAELEAALAEAERAETSVRRGGHG